MTYDELTYDQKNQLAQDYMCRLVNEDRYAEFFGVDWHEPSYGELADALELVGEELVREEYEGYCFGEDDFWS
jgi:hypothetical protein